MSLVLRWPLTSVNSFLISLWPQSRWIKHDVHFGSFTVTQEQVAGVCWWPASHWSCVLQFHSWICFLVIVSSFKALRWQRRRHWADSHHGGFIILFWSVLAYFKKNLQVQTEWPSLTFSIPLTSTYQEHRSLNEVMEASTRAQLKAKTLNLEKRALKDQIRKTNEQPSTEDKWVDSNREVTMIFRIF